MCSTDIQAHGKDVHKRIVSAVLFVVARMEATKESKTNQKM